MYNHYLNKLIYRVTMCYGLEYWIRRIANYMNRYEMLHTARNSQTKRKQIAELQQGYNFISPAEIG